MLSPPRKGVSYSYRRPDLSKSPVFRQYASQVERTQELATYEGDEIQPSPCYLCQLRPPVEGLGHGRL